MKKFRLTTFLLTISLFIQFSVFAIAETQQEFIEQTYKLEY